MNTSLTVDETNIYADDGVSVTTTRIMVIGTTYAVRNVTSVKMTAVPGPVETSAKIRLVGIGVGLTLGSFIMMAVDASVGRMVMVIGVAVFLVGLVVPGKPRPWIYNVVIATAGGEVSVFGSTDQKRILAIVEGINQAIIMYK